MRWHDPLSPFEPVQYCVDADADRTPDQVVFQQGMFVDPVTGKVSRGDEYARYVTMSCALGGVVLAYLWGYDYVGKPTDPAVPDPTFYFDAAIQMKRASYCGDWKHYTISGTRIRIVDNVIINDDHPKDSGNQSIVVEAFWKRDGAICLNQNNHRHPELAFDGCSDRILSECPAPSASQPLYNGLAKPSPPSS
jgi:hypothetical protein